MTEKELIRRALMGDEKAQEECTNRAIILPCPFCGGEAEWVEEAGLYSICCKDGTCIGNDIRPEYGELICAIADWNTRPATPIGRCGECKYYTVLGHCEVHSQEPDQYGSGAYVEMLPDDFCSYFEPREEK